MRPMHAMPPDHVAMGGAKAAAGSGALDTACACRCLALLPTPLERLLCPPDLAALRQVPEIAFTGDTTADFLDQVHG